MDITFHELHLRQAALCGPQPSPGQRVSGAVDADHAALGSHQVGGHERHVPGTAAQIQHPHAGPDARLGKNHPRRRGHRPALGLKAGHLVFTDAGAHPVAGVAITHRVPSLARPATIIPRPAPGLAAATYPALATVTETRDFLAVYATFRGRPFSPGELQRCWAAGVWTRAFDARKQHAAGQPVISLTQGEARERLRHAGMR